jgi:hypothetical protein
MSDVILSSVTHTELDRYPYMLQALTGDAGVPYADAEMRNVIDAVFKTSGVVGGTNQVLPTQNGAGDDSVNLSPGYIVVPGSSTKYLTRIKSSINVPIPAAPGTGTRTHRLIAEVYDPQISGAVYGWGVHVMEDTGSGTPALPSTLAVNIALVTRTAGAPTVLAAAIDNTPAVKRAYTDLPGDWIALGSSVYYRLCMGGKSLQFSGHLNATNDGVAIGGTILPGYRPLTTQSLVVSTNNQTLSNVPHLDVHTDGSVVAWGLQGASTGTVNISGIIALDI